MKKILNVGILAHADAGKTTLTENFLFHAQAIATPGMVDKGSSVSDTLEIEKKRGISVLSSTISFDYKDSQINLIDTPGHLDFSAEIDRAFAVLDIAILVLSAVEGIQGQSMQIWECLQERNIPTLIFINKIDRIGADTEALFKNIQNEWKILPFAKNIPNKNQVNILSKENTQELISQLSLENLAEVNEDFCLQFLDDKLPSFQEIQEISAMPIQQNKLIPVFFGSAKNQIGISELLDHLTLLNTQAINTQEHSLLVYKISHQERLGTLYHLKNFGVKIQPKDKIDFEGQSITIHQIFKQIGNKQQSISSLENNDIGYVSLSFNLEIGAVLGKSFSDKNYKTIANNTLSIQVKEQQAKDYQKLADALEILNLEDPILNFDWNKKEATFTLDIQGEIHIEILNDILQNRFNIPVDFKEIQIQYKETPKNKAEGFVRYWMPKPCWAIMTFEIEPGEINSGLVFQSNVSVNDISQKYQNEIKRAIPWALRQGIKGWEVTDLKITLLSGEEHQVHSNSGDFLLATPMGIMRALENADTDLLEPFYQAEMKFNADLLGNISTELHQMNAQIGIPEFQDNHVLLSAKFPVAKALKFPIIFNSISSGKGRLRLSISHYEKTETTEEKIRPYRGVSPLDQAQWILHYRGAYKADERIR